MFGIKNLKGSGFVGFNAFFYIEILGHSVFDLKSLI